MVADSGVSATTPSRLWWGVERIVVTCEADAGAERLEAALCAAAMDHIRSRVSRPVTTRAEARGGDPAGDLIIKISARQPQPGVLELTVRPKRIEIMNEAPHALIETVDGKADTAAALTALVARSLVKILPTK